jgi:hypothetical protein
MSLSMILCGYSEKFEPYRRRRRPPDITRRHQATMKRLVPALPTLAPESARLRHISSILLLTFLIEEPAVVMNRFWPQDSLLQRLLLCLGLIDSGLGR